jgi:integrase
MKTANVETRSARLKLPIARKPVFVRLREGVHLGYRRNRLEAGTWVLRLSDGKGGYSVKAMGAADDVAAANGKTVLDFAQAQQHALSRVSDDRVDSATPPMTIATALSRYEANLRRRGGDVGNAARVRMHLSKSLAARAVAAVTARELASWLDALAEKVAPGTVNRIAGAFKAALNLAADHDEIATRHAWKNGLTLLPNATKPRNVILKDDEVRDLVIEAENIGCDFADLTAVAAITGARVDQIARLTVGDLQADGDAPRLMIPVSKKGKGEKPVTHQPVPITSDLANRLAARAAGHSPTAPLLVKPSGRPWRKSDHSRLFARLARRCGHDPKIVTLYALRHSSIVRDLKSNTPPRIVAAKHDTSLVMLERHYSAYIGNHANELARAALLDIVRPVADNVVQIAIPARA